MSSTQEDPSCYVQLSPPTRGAPGEHTGARGRKRRRRRHRHKVAAEPQPRRCGCSWAKTLAALVVLALLGGGGYYGYTRLFADKSSSSNNNNNNNHNNNNNSPVTTPAPAEMATACNMLTGAMCNPTQLYVSSAPPANTWPQQSQPMFSEVPASAVSTKVLDTVEVSSSAGFLTTMSDVSSEQGSSFGISAHVGVDNVAFGGSIDSQHVFKSMQSTTNAKYYSRLTATVQQQQMTLTAPQSLTHSAAFAADMAAVADSRDVADWLAFFNTYGTHYASTLTYGGYIHSYCSMTSQEISSKYGSTSKASESISAGFGSWLGASFSHSSSHGGGTAADRQAWSSHQTLSVGGGDTSVGLGGTATQAELQEWVASINSDNWVVIGTQLTGIDALFPADRQAAAKHMLAKAVAMCPAATVSGTPEACAGVGYCTFKVPLMVDGAPTGNATAACTCPSDKQGEACGLNDIACPSSCSGHGTCDYYTGKCHCDGVVAGVSLGWTSDQCDTTCGVLQFGSKGSPPTFPGNDHRFAAWTASQDNDAAYHTAGNCACSILTGQPDPESVTVLLPHLNPDNPDAKTTEFSDGVFSGPQKGYYCNGDHCGVQIFAWNGCSVFTHLSCQGTEPTC